MKPITDFSNFYWENKPKNYEIGKDMVCMVTEPLTDYWQKTYYGFRHNNAHAFLLPVTDREFSFSFKCSYEQGKLFDQCGVVLYQNPENWFKASVEYDNPQFSRLGSVVTNLGYSDWASTDIGSNIRSMYYRLSRREMDFLIENSTDGIDFKQMRIFHMHQPIEAANIGIYACSPLESSIKTEFSEFSLGECIWKEFNTPN